MDIFIGLLIIAVGAFCQASFYLPLLKVEEWKWESGWLLQIVFALLVLPFIGALAAIIPSSGLFTDLFTQNTEACIKTILWGAMWGIGNLNFGLSMRYLGIGLGQSVALGTCAGFGTLLGPVAIGHSEVLTQTVIIGVTVTFVGCLIIAAAGSMKSLQLNDEQKKIRVPDFDFQHGILVAVICGLMSACFNIGLAQGSVIHFQGISPKLSTLPITFLVTLGGFIPNFIYCLYQHQHHHSIGEYHTVERSVLKRNTKLCLLAGALWYSQFFGLSLGRGFLIKSTELLTFSFCILMALNVVFSNVWGFIRKEWEGCTKGTYMVLVIGVIILIIASFLPQVL